VPLFVVQGVKWRPRFVATSGDTLTVNYTYDGAGRKLSDGNGTFTYDGAGRMTTASNSNGTYAISYDLVGRLTKVTEPFGLSLGYSYDDAGNQTQVLDSQSGTTVSTYDSDYYLTRRTYQGQSQTFRRDFTNNKEGWNTTLTRYSDLNGTTLVATTAYGYDNVGQVTSVLSTDASSATINQFIYSIDSADRLTSETDTQNGGAATTTSYSYDSNGQVTLAGGTSYGYDRNGNRTGGSYAVTTGNEMSADANWTYSYDKEGNLKEKDTTTGGSSEKWTYTYSANNLLTEAKHYNTAGTLDLTVDYKYDAFGEQIEEDVNGTAFAKFGIDGWNSNMASPIGNENMNVWARLDVNSSLINRYLWGDHVDQQLVGRIDLGPSKPYWTLQDRLGSIRDVINNSGGVVDDIKYDAFGNITAETDATHRGWYAYTGREYDTETNLQYNHARWYDATMGRWISQDPLGFEAGDSNLYRYVNNGPTHAVDPSGLQEGFAFGMAMGNVFDQQLLTEMKGKGDWNALDFFRIGMGAKVTESEWRATWVWGDWVPVPMRYTWRSDDATTYMQGCIGLVTLRLGKDPYKCDSFFIDVKDAAKKAKAMGQDARIIAIQSIKLEWKENKDPNFPSSVTLTSPKTDTSSGNHATWHQTGKNEGYWEWLGPWGWLGPNMEGDEKRTSWESRARAREVHHRVKLSASTRTVYGVINVEAHKWRPPLECDPTPTGAPKNK
jgi:RHS repeat-associated protein